MSDRMRTSMAMLVRAIASGERIEPTLVERAFEAGGRLVPAERDELMGVAMERGLKGLMALDALLADPELGSDQLMALAAAFPHRMEPEVQARETFTDVVADAWIEAMREGQMEDRMFVRRHIIARWRLRVLEAMEEHWTASARAQYAVHALASASQDDENILQHPDRLLPWLMAGLPDVGSIADQLGILSRGDVLPRVAVADGWPALLDRLPASTAVFLFAARLLEERPDGPDASGLVEILLDAESRDDRTDPRAQPPGARLLSALLKQPRLLPSLPARLQARVMNELSEYGQTPRLFAQLGRRRSDGAGRAPAR